ncbi:MAG: hypothetical protein JO302_07050 [Candidatus Eremiobacteraeota bacterium]|nr:hypothetical protein [Candidatus Eremiobacteraeota bacterium]
MAAVAFLYGLGVAFQIHAPSGPEPDQSWTAGVDVAARNHFVFGRDIIFTWGPLSFLGVTPAVPSAYHAAVTFSLIIAGATTALLVWRALSEGTTLTRIIFFIVALIVIGVDNQIDFFGGVEGQLFYDLVLILTLPALARARPIRWWAFSVGIFVGISSLIKFSFCIDGIIAGIAVLAIRPLQDKPRIAFAAAVETIVLFFVGFAISSAGVYEGMAHSSGFGPLVGAVGAAFAVLWIARSNYAFAVVSIACASALVLEPLYRQFFYYSIQIASGYSSSSSLEAPSTTLSAGLLVLAIIALLITRDWKTLGASRSFGLLVLLWLAFKEGFVRADGYHMIYFFLAATLIASTLLLCAEKPASRAFSGVGVVLSLVTLVVLFSSGAPQDVFEAMSPALAAKGLQSAFETVTGQGRSKEALIRDYKLRMRPHTLAPSVVRKLGNSAVNLVGYETNVVFANALRWKPQPVFQPYNAYTPALDGLDRDNIALGDGTRELLTYASYDNVYPFAEEPSAYLKLICNYAADDAYSNPLSTRNGDQLIVLKPVQQRCTGYGRDRVGQIGWNQALPVGAPPRRLAVLSVDLRYSLLGAGLDLLYKVGPVFMVARYEDGSSNSFRVLPGVSGDGILVNPVPKNLPGVLALLRGRSADRVRSVQFSTLAPWLFTPQISYRLEERSYLKRQ